MSNKVNNTIPANTVIGVRQITTQFRNINLNREALDYLTSIGGTFRLEISGGTNTLSHSIVDENGKFLCTTRELEQLANYKTFVTKKKEELSLTAGKDKMVAVHHNLKQAYEAANGQGTCPDRMVEANTSKFGQLKKSVDVINRNIKVIETLPTGAVRTYLLNQGATLARIYIKGLIACMGPTKYEQTTHDEWIFGCCIPKYLENKFVDPNFTKDAKLDATPLLFPRGNFVKSISLQTREIASDTFLNANRVVITNSHSIIQLARSADLKHLFIPEGSELEAELEAQYEKFYWPMLAPGTVEEFLAPRVNRVNVKPFSEALPPKAKPGQKGFRPETPFQKQVRELKNLQQKMMSTILDFFHFLPRVDDPLHDFWIQFFQTDDWVISPEMTIYHWIDQAPNRDTALTAIMNNSLALVKTRLVDIIGMQLDIPNHSQRHIALRAIIMATGANNTHVDYPDNPPVATATGALPNHTTDDLENTGNVTDIVRKEVATFCGKATEEVLASEKTKAIIGKRQIDKRASKFIRKITDNELRDSIEKWIRENFRSAKLQNLAAEYAAMAIEDENLGYDTSEDEDSSSEEGGVW